MFIFGIILIALLLIACGVNITSDKNHQRDYFL